MSKNHNTIYSGFEKTKRGQEDKRGRIRTRKEKNKKNKKESSRRPGVVMLIVTVLLIELPNSIDTPFTASTVMWYSVKNSRLSRVMLVAVVSTVNMLDPVPAPFTYVTKYLRSARSPVILGGDQVSKTEALANWGILVAVRRRGALGGPIKEREWTGKK